MNEMNKLMLESFKDNRPTYLQIEDKIVQLLKKAIKDNNLIIMNLESRVKAYDSLSGKLELKGYKYKTLNDITDLIGIRVITFYDDEVDKIAAIVENLFEIDRSNSVDKRKLLESDQFGYLSVHYICSVPNNILSELGYENNGLKFEIQIRTVLQHTWASINHDIGYKSHVEIPKEYFRRFSRLASLLEIADNEFSHIRTEIDVYRNKVLEIVKSGKFSDVELTLDSFKEYLSLKPFNKLTSKIALINKADIEEMNIEMYLLPLKFFGFKTLGDLEDLRINYEEDAYQLALYQLGGTDIDIISSSVGINYLCYAYLIKNDYSVKDLTDFLNLLYGESRSNGVTARNIFNVASKIGMVK